MYFLYIAVNILHFCSGLEITVSQLSLISISVVILNPGDASQNLYDICTTNCEHKIL